MQSGIIAGLHVVSYEITCSENIFVYTNNIQNNYCVILIYITLFP